MNEILIEKICQIILNHRGDAGQYGCKQQLCAVCAAVIRDKIKEFIANNQIITFILPAFPAKSANRNKTLSKLPDYGEELALKNLNSIMSKINAIYEPGAKIIICSDGTVFSDLVGVKDEDVTLYHNEILNITKKYNLTNIELFNLEDVWQGVSCDTMRENLLKYFATPIVKIRNDIKNNLEEKNMFNGVHRFILEDMYIKSESVISKNQAREQAKKISYYVMQRSHAWSDLIKSLFPQSVRFSIHPYRCGSNKFAISLIPNSNRWATPWHNVIVEDSFGNVALMKQAEAQMLEGHIVVYNNNKPSHYKIINISALKVVNG